MKINKEVKLEYLFLAVILVYVTLHLLEEGLFGFEIWAGKRWGIPNYTLVKWLISNAFFLFFLILGYVVYRINKEKFLPIGIGIIFWGLFNALNHIVFSLIFLEYSPGLVSGLLYILLTVFALRAVHKMNKMSTRLIVFSLLCGVAYWVLPMASFVTLYIATGI